MDSVLLSDSERVLDGLRDMMIAADDADGLVQSHVDVLTALLIIEISKRAEDRVDWFPRGKWATMQALQERCSAQLDKMFRHA